MFIIIICSTQTCTLLLKIQLSRNEDEKLMRILLTLLISSLLALAALPSQQIQNNMSPASNNNNAINSDDVASYGNILRLRFPSMPMRSSTPFFVEAQTDANADDFTDLEDNQHPHHNSNSSEAEAGSNVEADSTSSNGHEESQEVERRVSDGGDGGDPPPMDLQFDSSSSDTSSHPSNGVADTNNHRQDRRKGWISKPNCGSIGLTLLAVVAVVACVYTIINNNMKKNALISDLQNEISSLKKEQQYLLDISQQGGGKKGKAGKDECCACLTSSVRFLSLSIYPLLFLCLCVQ